MQQTLSENKILLLYNLENPKETNGQKAFLKRFPRVSLPQNVYSNEI